MLKEYFANYFLHMSNMTFDMVNNEMHVHHQRSEPWKVTLVDTGDLTQTGDRVKRFRDHLDGTFCMTYGDGLSNIDIADQLAFHKKEGRTATISAVHPEGRFGSLEIEGTKINRFLEKPKGDGQWVSGGFMVCEPEVLDRLDGDATIFEQGPFMGLANDGQLSVRKRHGFWAAMDTLRDRNALGTMWAENDAPWHVWE